MEEEGRGSVLRNEGGNQKFLGFFLLSSLTGSR